MGSFISNPRPAKTPAFDPIWGWIGLKCFSDPICGKLICLKWVSNLIWPTPGKENEKLKNYNDQSNYSKLPYVGKMDRLYTPDHNHIFRKLSRKSSGDFPRLPGLKYDDVIMKNGPRSDQTTSCFLLTSTPGNRSGTSLVIFSVVIRAPVTLIYGIC